jgi:predicted DNA-binding transcriptional regulator
MASGVPVALKELKAGAPGISTIVTDIFIFSYFVFSVLITLNVFIAVMASQIQEKIKTKIDEQSKVLKRIEELEGNIQKSINEIDRKFEAMKK